MKHRMIDRIIYKAYQRVNNGYQELGEVVGHGCPLGMDYIPLNDPSIQFTSDMAYNSYIQKINKYLKNPRPLIPTPNVESYSKGYTKGTCMTCQINVVMPLKKNVLPVLEIRATSYLNKTEEYIQKCKDNYKQVVNKRISEGSTYKVNGVLWFKAIKK